MALGMLAKESAYAFPLLLVVLLPLRRAPWTRRAVVLAPYFAVTACLFLWRWSALHGIGGYAGRVGVIPMLKTLALRLRAILFFPINWTVTPEPILGMVTVIYLGALLWLFTARVPRTQLLVPLGLVLAAALPPAQQLLIGMDLQKSRLLYLPSVGFCLLVAAAAEHLRPFSKRAAAIAVIAFHLVALGHNLSAWEYASGKTMAACSAVAACLKGPADKIAVSGLPGSLKGVYASANGFPECVAMQSHARPAQVEQPDGRQTPDQAAYACVLSWDPSTDTLRPKP
jgi:hypothetical protein